jgi:molybdopterin synthase sulfur carrier subunit
MRIRYFAWVRERIGHPEDDLAPPADVATAGDLVRWLAGRGEEYAYALERPEVIRVALDQVHVTPDTPLGAAREAALFPPMTGG